MRENGKIRIAVLETRYGGDTVFVNDLYERMDRSFIEVRFFYLRGAGNQQNHLRDKGFPVHYLSEGGWYHRLPPFRFGRLIRLLREHRIDLLHCHTHKPTIYGAVAGRFLPHLKVVSHVHGLRRSDRWRRKLANFLFAGRVDRFLTVAAAVRDDLIAGNWRISPDRVQVLENSVDYERFASVTASPAEVRRMLSLPEDAFVFGTIGRLTPTKGLSFLLEAFAEVYRQFPQTRLVLVGEGPEETRCRRLANRLGIEGAACFTGFRRDVDVLLRGMNVFVIASVAEGMARVLMESMAAGRPCIATRVGGIPEIVDDSVGVLVEAQNPHAMAAAMIDMMSRSESELERLRDAAARRALTRYDHAVAMEKLKTHYLEVLNGQRGSGKCQPSVS